LGRLGFIQVAIMTVPANSNTSSQSNAPETPEAVAALRRKLGFRAWHRGTREADLLIGSFADRHVAALNLEELAQFQRLLEENDPDIYDWMIGLRPPPPEHDNRVMALLREFRFVSKPS
jgi:antitoxin CptB